MKVLILRGNVWTGDTVLHWSYFLLQSNHSDASTVQVVETNQLQREIIMIAFQLDFIDVIYTLKSRVPLKQAILKVM